MPKAETKLHAGQRIEYEAVSEAALAHAEPKALDAGSEQTKLRFTNRTK
jgi:hypothetical protein